MGLKHKTITAALGALIFGTAFFLSCSQNAPQSPGHKVTGSIAPKILYKNAAGAAITLPPALKASLQTMRLTLTPDNGDKVVREFPYAGHSATLADVPAGNAHLKVEAIDSGNAVVMTGNVNVTVRAAATEEPGVPITAATPAVPYLCFPVQAPPSSVVLRWIVWETGSMAVVIATKVMRKIKTDATFAEIGTISWNANTYTDASGLSCNVAYEYRLKFETGVTQFFTNVQTAILSGDSVSLTPPTLSTPVFTSPNVALSWTFPAASESQIQRFEVYRSLDGAAWGTPHAASLAVTARSYTDNAPPANQTVYYKVVAVDLSSNSYSSDVMSVSTVVADPLIPVLSTPVYSSPDVSFSWTFLTVYESQIQYFEVYSSSDGVTWGSPLPGSVSKTLRSYTDITPPANQTVYYKVVAIDNSNGQHSSNVKSVSTVTGGVDKPYTGTKNGILAALQASNLQVKIAGGATIISLDTVAGHILQQKLPDSTTVWTLPDPIDQKRYYFVGQDANQGLIKMDGTRPIVLEFLGGSGGTCPADMALTSGYCIDKKEFPGTPPALENVSFATAESNCIAAGKRLCFRAEWEDACIASKSGGALDGIVTGLDGGLEEWATGTTGLVLIGNNMATCLTTAPSPPYDGRWGLGFRCCKLPQ
ncbi:MAG: hypothetical protein V1913_04495 [Fibrobacterota bacterium]